MKKHIFIIFLMLTGSFVIAQTPEVFKYQAVIGNESGEILANTTVALKISVLKDSQTGTVVYVETFHPTTNPHGLVDVEIGNGSFYSIDWGETDYFLRVEVDPYNGSSFTHLGTSPLLSVPYALHARTVQMDKVDDADADPGNELQNLTLVGSDLTLSRGGGTVTLPTSVDGDNWGSQVVESDATLSGVGTSGDPLSVIGDLTDDQTLSLMGTSLHISGGNTVKLATVGVGDDWGSQVVESDATLSGVGISGDPLSVMGDLTDDQTLSLVGNDLSISDGNSVTLPSGADNWGSQVVESDATLSGVGTSGDPLSVMGDLTDDQTLSLVGNDLSISDGNSVTLPSGADNWGSQVVVSNTTLSGNGTSGTPLGVVGDLTDDQTLSYSAGNLSISGGNSISMPASPWLLNASNIYYNSGNVGIGVSSPSETFHVYGQSLFDLGTGTVRISTPGSYPGFIVSDIVSNHRRDIVFRPEGIALMASTSNSLPGGNDGIYIGEGGNVGIQTWSTGTYPLLINERTDRGMALNHSSSGSLWEIFSSSDGSLYLYRNNHVMRGHFDGTSGTYMPVSDRGFKKDIKSLNTTLNRVMHIKPSAYTMRSSTDGRREIGIIAQELKEYFPELVYDIVDEMNGQTVYMVNYNGVAVVAVKAIQEQQEIIEQQAKTIQEQSDRINELERKFDLLQKRVTKY